MSYKTALLFFALITFNKVCAQSYQGLDAVKLYDVVRGDSLALNHKSSGVLVVLIFTSNTCPYSVKYESRILQLSADFSSKDVEIVLVNPNSGPEDGVQEMKSKASELGYTFPYLKDHDQILTDIFSATRTPEAFLLKPVSGGFELLYSGAIDDNPQAGSDVENHHLKNAIEKSLRGETVAKPQTRVTGCIIRG